jgi:hypothetical protein
MRRTEGFIALLEDVDDRNTSSATPFKSTGPIGVDAVTLSPGDIISGGSPAGTNVERAEPRWTRAGDTAKCAIEGIGTQTHPVVAEGGTPSTQ